MDTNLTNDDAQMLIELLEQRGVTYALLARLYEKEVDAELLDEMHGCTYPVVTGNEHLDKGYYQIAKYLSNLWEDSLSELSVDFGTVFIGQGMDSYSAAYPQESVYTSEKRLIMQEARDEVLAIYRAYGIVKDESWKECEDHISLELQFERVLNDRTVELIRASKIDDAVELLEAQRGFLADHLNSWAPMMTEDVRKFAQTDFYQGLAELTDGFLEADEAFLDDLLVEE